MDNINLDQLRTAFLTGGVRTVGLAASGGLFLITAQLRDSGEWVVLKTTRGKQGRVFKDPGKAILLLHEIGVKKIAVDVSRWEPERAVAAGWRRPDVAGRQRRAHEAAALDTTPKG